MLEGTETRTGNGNPGEIESASGTFAIYSTHERPACVVFINRELFLMSTSYRTQDVSFTTKDLAYSQANLGIGGCLISVHEPAEAVAWIEDNWDSPLLTSIHNGGCAGPLAWMLSPFEPALAIFGWNDSPVVVGMAQKLAEVSGLPVVVRPPSDNPALTLLCVKLFIPFVILRDSHSARDADLQNVPVQFGGTPGNNNERIDNRHAEDETGEEDGRVPQETGDGGDGGRRDGDLENPEPNGYGLNMVDAHHGYNGGQGDGGGDGDGGGPTSIDGEWKSPLHRTQITLRLEVNNGHIYEVTIGYTYQVGGIYSNGPIYRLNFFSSQSIRRRKYLLIARISLTPYPSPKSLPLLISKSKIYRGKRESIALMQALALWRIGQNR
jgi:hypothetical protein